MFDILNGRNTLTLAAGRALIIGSDAFKNITKNAKLLDLNG